MRVVILAAILFSFCHAIFCQEVPTWLKDPKGFCQELAKRANPKDEPVPIGKPQRARFADYPARPIARQRAEEGVLGRPAETDERSFSREVREEAAKGPDFAGRYAILTWTCGSWCVNATIAEVLTGKTYEPPFVGVVGCANVTGDLDTLQRKADSSLLIIRGSLEMSFGDYFDEGPCGVFYFRWVPNRLQLIGCDMESKTSEPK